MNYVLRWVLPTFVVLFAILTVRLFLPTAIEYQKLSSSYDPFEITLYTPRVIRIFQSAPLAMEIKNISNQDMDLWLGGDPSHDFSITTENGKEIWRMTNQFAVQDILLEKSFKSGETLRLEGNWDQRTNRKLYMENRGFWVLPGTYQVRGFINAGDPSGQIEIGPIPLRIVL
jgi:hypothetical protein